MNEIPNNGFDDDNNGYIDDTQGWDFVNNDNDPFYSTSPHGTEMAGVAAAITNNNLGVAGVCWRCKIMNLHMSPITTSRVVNALTYAMDNGAKITSNSWGGGSYLPNYDLQIKNAFDLIYANGLLSFMAAGNDGAHVGTAPAAFNSVLGVTGTNANDDWAFYNYGGWFQLASPATDIWTTYPTALVSGCPSCSGPYVLSSGTSPATPLAAGIAALIWSKKPSLTNVQVENIMRTAVDPLQLVIFPNAYLGEGRVNAYKALQYTTIPEAKLDWTMAEKTISAPTQIIGTAQGAGTSQFSHYILEYGSGPYPLSWTPFGGGNSAVVNGVLGVLNPLGMPLGYYAIRVQTFDSNGIYAIDSTTVTIQ